MSRGRNYVFTANSPDGVLDPETDGWDVHVSYVTWQLEVGESGTLHYQGYIECLGMKSMRQLHELPGLEGAHFEIRKGSQEQAIAYAQKRDTRVEGPWEWGTPKAQGKRSDLLEIKRKVDDGYALERVWDEHYGSMIRYHRSIKEYKRIKAPKRAWVPQVFVIWGPSGSGKSRLARELFPDAYWKPLGKWWDDYDQQSTVVWDEFKGQYPFQELLRVLDSTPLLVETKGSHTQFVADTIVFTSNFHPSEWYSEDSVKFTWADSPLNRRLREFGEYIYLGSPPESLGNVPQSRPVVPRLAPQGSFLWNGVPTAMSSFFNLEN